MDYKALYEQQQQETDREHQRYLEVSEKYSDKLWEVCQELDIENDDTSQNIIEEIKKLKAENKNLKAQNEYLWEPVNADDYIRLQRQYDELKDQIKKYENRWKMFNVEQELEIKILTAEYGTEEIRNCMKENEKLKAEYDELKQGQIKEIKTMKNKCLKSVCKLNKKIKELQKQIEELQKDVLTDEPEVETCRECNTKRECLSDIFITIRELDGTESVMCGMCSLNHFKSKS